MSAGLTVTSRLNAEVAARRLESDPAQREAAVRLDGLREVLDTTPTGILRRLRARMPWLPIDASAAPVRGVYLWGDVGRGKTLLMDFFFASIRSDSAQSGAMPGAERTHFYRFMRDVHAALAGIKQQARPLDIVAQQLAARARLICLDEFFVSDIADAMILAGLLEGLFRRGVTLVTTSNVPPEELYKNGLQRQRFLPAIDLLQANTDVVRLDGGVDYRLRQLRQARTYLDSAATDTAAAVRQTFAALAGGGGAGPSALSIEGRTLHVIDSGPGLAWFEFTELCEGPRSQNDYIELARLFHTLVVANVPIFDTSNENAARRFIMLIDELYDRSVKIIISAAAAPAALYRGERLKFEFERAASRLVEMQTEEYLAGQHRP